MYVCTDIYTYKETKFEVTGWLSRDVVAEDRQRLRPWDQQCWQRAFSTQIPLTTSKSIGVVYRSCCGSPDRKLPMSVTRIR